MSVEIFIHAMPEYLARMLILGDAGIKCAVVLDDLPGPEAL